LEKDEEKGQDSVNPGIRKASSSILGLPSPRAVEFAIKWKDIAKLKCGWK